MARTLNQVLLLGNVGRDPEIRYTQKGVMTVNFSLATTERAKGSDGRWGDRPEWHSIVAYDQAAEYARENIKRGAQVLVHGRLHTLTWTTRSETQKRVVVQASVFYLSGPQAPVVGTPPPEETLPEEELTRMAAPETPTPNLFDQQPELLYPEAQ